MCGMCCSSSEMDEHSGSSDSNESKGSSFGPSFFDFLEMKEY